MIPTDTTAIEQDETPPAAPEEVIEFFADDPLFTSVARETAPHAAQH